MPDWKRLRRILLDRSRGFCESCGFQLNPEDWAAHHRQLRSHQGAHETNNLVALHHECHNLAPRSVHMRPRWARERGLIVPMAMDPATTPLMLPGGSWVLLGDVYAPCEAPC